MTWVRSIVFLVWMYGLLLVMGVLWLPTLLMPRRSLRGGMRLWNRLVIAGLRVICGVRVEFRGLEHRPTGPALIAAKHLSQLDTIAPFTVMPDVAFVLKQELLALPIFGWYARKARMIAVDRAGQAKALKQLLADAQDRLADGRQIIIFPEGTRQEPGSGPDYKPGVAGLYRDLGLPCALLATNSGLCWPGKGLLRRPGTVVFEFLEPIPPGLKRVAFMQQLEERLECASNALLTTRR